MAVLNGERMHDTMERLLPGARSAALLWQGALDTLYMTLVSTFFAYVIGLPLLALLAGSLPPARDFWTEFSVALGCDIRHACHLVYAQGLDLHAPAAATPIGMGCKVCERHACPQRAFPYIGRALDVDENHSRFTPYGAGA